MRKLLFSVTRGDCEWKYTKGSGPGGQKKNKTSSAVYCTHKESGARGYAEDTRSQAKNRSLAFKRMVETKEFKHWHRVEVSKRCGNAEEISRKIDKEMKNIRVEVKENGKWVPDTKSD